MRGNAASGRPGVLVVPEDYEAQALAALSLHVLPLELEHAETFAAWGLRTCGELAALAETDLTSRLGQAGKKLHGLARGDWPHLMTPAEPSFEAGLVEARVIEDLCFVARAKVCVTSVDASSRRASIHFCRNSDTFA